MSQKEFEQQDEQVMDMVNGHSAPEATAAAEQIVETVNTTLEESEDQKHASNLETDMERHRKAEWFRKKKLIANLRLVLFVTACLCVAAALVAAWYVPALLIWVVNVGVLACGVAAAMEIQRFVRRWR